MKFVFIVALVLAGIGFGYVYSRWGAKKDERARAAQDAMRPHWDWYVVKLRLPYMYSEGSLGVITVEVKAKDREHAQQEARRILKGRSLTRCEWVSVNRL